MARRRLPLPHPLAEVFGFPPGSTSAEAQRYRDHKWCPYNNPTGANCTKDSIKDPLGVCSVLHKNSATITCPVRFRQDWRILDDAGEFFFPDYPKDQPRPRMLSEIPLKDKSGKSAGTIDIVLITLDDDGYITDYGALEIQAVYISGNVRGVFNHYINDPANYETGFPTVNYPRPDYLSSSRKRLAPQLIYKGGILNSWGRKMAVAVQRGFFETLPKLDTLPREQAQVAWLVYDLQYDVGKNHYDLVLTETIYTDFKESLNTITMPNPGDERKFMGELQTRVRTRKTPPDIRELPVPYDLANP